MSSALRRGLKLEAVMEHSHVVPRLFDKMKSSTFARGQTHKTSQSEKPGYY
jgi:hypothetical protein